MDGTRLMARNGRRTRTVRIADKLKLSPGITDSTNLYNILYIKNNEGFLCLKNSYPAITIKQSSLFHVSAKYVPLPNIPIAVILIHISIVKNPKIK